MTSMMPKPAATTTGRHANSQLISHPTITLPSYKKDLILLHSVHFPKGLAFAKVWPSPRSGLRPANHFLSKDSYVPFYLDSGTKR